MNLYNADCIEKMKELPENSVDSIVCDPPYELGFMGKSWDSTGIANNIDMWAECLRVLKPGGHLLAFSGTRTYHRMASAIEDAGFEVRDMIEWVYGSGFPKSLNIGKAVDKLGGQSLSWFIDYILKVADEKGISRKELTMLFPSKNGNPTGWLWNKQKTQGITLEQYHKIKEFLQLPFADITECEREIVGRGKAGLTMGTIANFSGEKEFDLTKGTSEWEGWGTALKPAHEPICMARKPLAEKTVAQNVLKYGTGGINIDESRVDYQSEADKASATPQGKCTSNTSAGSAPDVDMSEVDYNGERYWYKNEYKWLVDKWLNDEDYVWSELKENLETYDWCKVPEIDSGDRVLFDSGEGVCIRLYESKRKEFVRPEQQGRFPSNLIHDNSEEVRECFPEVGKGNGKGAYNYAGREYDNKDTSMFNGDKPQAPSNFNDSGSASRFFKSIIYQAKASKSERGQGNKHPTVKPVALMEYLITMVTREEQTVLDPFMGSGTTGVACKNLNRNFIGIELDKEYFEIARKRIEEA